VGALKPFSPLRSAHGSVRYVMEKITDWNALWRELVELKAISRKTNPGEIRLPISGQTGRMNSRKGLSANGRVPIRAGNLFSPNWILMALCSISGRHRRMVHPLRTRVKHVTAVEPSGSMIEVMRESLVHEKISNVSIVQGEWPMYRSKSTIIRCALTQCMLPQT